MTLLLEWLAATQQLRRTPRKNQECQYLNHSQIRIPALHCGCKVREFESCLNYGD